MQALAYSSVSTRHTWPMKRERFSVNSVSEGPVGMKYSVIRILPLYLAASHAWRVME